MKKSAANNLSNQYHLLQNILNCMTDLVYIVNENKEIEFINAALKKAFGPINEQKCHKYMAGNSKPCSWCRHEEVMGGNTIRWDWQCKKDGKIYDVIETSIVYPNDHIRKLKIMRDVSDIKLYEKNLQRERDLLITIMENTHIMTAFLDVNFNFIHVNTAYSKGSGYQKEALIGKNHFDLFPDDDNLTIFKEVRQNGESVEFFDKVFEFLNQPKRGVTLWNWALHPTIDSSGDIYGLVFTLQETTEHKRLQFKIENLAKFPDENPNPIMRISFDGSVIYANQSGKIILKTWNLMVGDKVPEFLQNEMNNITQKSEPGRIEINSDNRFFLFEIVPIVKENYCNVYGLDITEKQNIEDKLKESETRHKLAQEAACVGTWDWDLKTGHLIWSDTIEPLFGMHKGEFKSTYNDFIHCLHPEDKQDVLEAIDKCIEKKENFDVQHRVVWPDGSIHWLREIGNVLRDEHLIAVRMLGVVQDITEQKKARELLENSKDELENRVKERTEELENLNKRMKNEITERKTYQDLLHSLTTRQAQMEEEVRRRIATGLHDRIVQTLALAKIKLENAMDTNSDQNIKDSLEEIHGLVDINIDEIHSLTFELSPPILYEMGLVPAIEWFAEQMSKKHNLKIRIKDNGQSKPVHEDIRNVLFHTVCELLNNVQKHAQAKKVSILIYNNHDDITIQVKDDGIGFDANNIKPDMLHLTQFGLFNIKERLKFLNGHVDIKSKINGGSSILVKVPIDMND